MLASIARHWWLFLVRGIIAVLFGILAFAWPGITLMALVLVFGIYAIIDGCSAIAVGVAANEFGARWWQMILVGMIGIIAGVLTFIWPAITAVALLAIIAVWSIIRGVLEIYAAIKLRALVEKEWLLILGAVCSILFGVLVIARPGAGALAVLWIIGIYAIIFGILSMALAFKLQALKSHLTHDAGAGGVTPAGT